MTEQIYKQLVQIMPNDHETALWPSKSKGPVRIVDMDDHHLLNTIKAAERHYHDRVATRMQDIEDGVYQTEGAAMAELKLDQLIANGPDTSTKNLFRHLVFEARMRGIPLPKSFWIDNYVFLRSDQQEWEFAVNPKKMLFGKTSKPVNTIAKMKKQIADELKALDKPAVQPLAMVAQPDGNVGYVPSKSGLAKLNAEFAATAKGMTSEELMATYEDDTGHDPDEDLV